MTKFMTLAAAIALVAALTSPALAAKPPPLSSVDVSQFKVGEATIQDVEAKLGKPMAIYRFGNITSITYSDMRTHVKPVTLIPYVGLFVGGATSTGATLTFVFDANGNLASTSQTGMNIDCNTGLVNTGCSSGGSGP